MTAFTTEGLILKRKDFGEVDRVLTVLTERFGKISVIARGVRRITSRRAGNIELLNRVRLHIFKAKSYTLTEAESLETFTRLKENLTLATTAFHILELVNRLTAEEQKNSGIYGLVISVLKVLEKNPRQIFVRAFEVKILNLLGFWSINALYDLSSQTKILLKKFEDMNWKDIGEIKLSEKEALELERVLRYYIERTIESELKSVKVLKKLKNE